MAHEGGYGLYDDPYLAFGLLKAHFPKLNLKIQRADLNRSGQH